MTFSFSLYTMFLLVALVIYFEMKLGDLEGENLLKDGELYHCQHWK